MNIVPHEPAPIAGEILLPSDTVRIIGKTSPLNGGRIERSVSAGLSIAEIMEDVLADRTVTIESRDFVIHINGSPIEQRHWRRIRPKPGTVVTFIPALHGGNWLKSALMVVVAIAATVVSGGALAPLLGPAFAAGTVASLAGVGVVASGKLSRDALFNSSRCTG